MRGLAFPASDAPREDPRRRARQTEIRDALTRSGLDGEALLARALTRDLAGDVAVMSSFGAESVLLLAMVAAVAPSTPVLFLETRRHFAETLRYRNDVVERLGLCDVRDVEPDPLDAEREDPAGELWYFDPDACCGLRKVRPLASALAPFGAWVTGRKRHQAGTRAGLGLVEIVDGRIKLNPLAHWSASDVAAERARRDLPGHPLTASGYISIGCAPCTRPVIAGEDDRAGRWRGSAKTECGIHGST